MRCRTASSQRISGFTLVELLIVIGIITILVAMLLPSLTRARQHAQKAQCLSQLRQVGLFFQKYQAESRGAMIPIWIHVPPVYSGITWAKYIDDFTVYRKMDYDYKLLKCPARDASNDPAPGWNLSTRLHYGMNQFINSYSPPLAVPGSGTESYAYWPKITKIHSTSATFYIADVVSYWSMAPNGNIDAPNFVHRGMANALFLDGHAESLTSDAFLKPALTWAAANPGIWYYYRAAPWHGNANDNRYLGW